MPSTVRMKALYSTSGGTLGGWGVLMARVPVICDAVFPCVCICEALCVGYLQQDRADMWPSGEMRVCVCDEPFFWEVWQG